MTNEHVPPDLAGVRASIQAALVEQVIPSLAVAVARQGRILWEEGFGWADREQRVPATEHTLYSLASISKPITATGLMVLVEQGKVDLDRPINDYLGDSGVTARVGEATAATVRRVANHTSGMPLHYHFFPVDEPHRRPPMGETIRRYANLVTAPGERYQYSNLGYGLLDHIIARVSGKPYADFMREQVFLPLGMTHASIDLPPELEPYQAIRYLPDGRPLPFYDFDHPGGSAAFSSAHDLVRFGMFHLRQHLADQKPILSDATLDAMQVPTSAGDNPSGYGVGWDVRADRHGHRTVAHDGGMAGVTTTLVLVPAEELAIVVLANASSRLPHTVATDIVAALLPPFAARRAEAEARPQSEQPAAASEFTPRPELLGEWQGNVHTYQGEMPLRLTFKESGDVHARLGTQLRTLVNDAAFRDGALTGRMWGEIETGDARYQPHDVQLDLRLRGDVLNGAAIAVARPGQRLGMALSHWAELRRLG